MTARIFSFSCKTVLALAALSASSIAPSQTASALDKLSFGVANPAGLNIGWAPYYYAQEMGFIKEEGIEVEPIIIPGAALLAQLANKTVDIGWLGPDPIIISHDAGKDPAPVRYFYNHLRRQIYEIVVPADSKIKTLKDLKGATIGETILGAANITSTKSVLHGVGLNPTTDVTFLAVGAGASALEALRKGQIDALNLFDTLHVQLELNGFPIRRLDMPESYSGLFENGMATNVDNLTAKKKPLAGFGRALAKGTIGCYANLPACVKMAWTQDPKTKIQAKSDDDNMKEAVAVLTVRKASYFYFPDGEKGQWGSYGDAGWKNRIAELYENQILHTDKIPVNELYSNVLVADMNAFDTDAVVVQAKALK
jgi:NitT/TauT family transport system substrate-binding protein